MIEKRSLTASDEAAFYELAQYAFNKPDSQQRRGFFKQLYQNSNGFGIFADDDLKSMLLATPFNVNFNGQTFKMSGIGYVASYPEFSGQGGISALMTLAFDQMHQDGVTLSYLAPFSYGFYRRFGYEQVFDQTHFEIQTQDLPRLKFPKSLGQVTRYSLADASDLIANFHETHPLNQVGGVQRPDWWRQYQVMKHPDQEIAIYTDQEDQVGGYVIYSRQGSVLVIEELMTSTVASQQQLVNFIFKHQSAYTTIRYESSLTTGLADLLPDPTVLKTTVVPYMMARIVDLADFLARYPYQTDELATVTIDVTDDFLPVNSGLWQISLHDGQPTITKLATGTADITVTIQNLTKALMGYRSLTSLAQYGQIEGQPTAIQQLDQAISHEKPMLWDYF